MSAAKYRRRANGSTLKTGSKLKITDTRSLFQHKITNTHPAKSIMANHGSEFQMESEEGQANTKTDSTRQANNRHSRGETKQMRSSNPTSRALDVVSYFHKQSDKNLNYGPAEQTELNSRFENGKQKCSDLNYGHAITDRYCAKV